MGARVLVVEDEPTMARMISLALTGAGYEVEMASDGSEGLELLTSGAFSLVVTDLNMPEMNGDAMLAQARAAGAAPPAIVLCGMTPDKTIDNVVYVTKPITTAQLLEVVRAQIDEAA